RILRIHGALDDARRRNFFGGACSQICPDDERSRGRARGDDGDRHLLRALLRRHGPRNVGRSLHGGARVGDGRTSRGDDGRLAHERARTNSHSANFWPSTGAVSFGARSRLSRNGVTVVTGANFILGALAIPELAAASYLALLTSLSGQPSRTKAANSRTRFV